MTCKVKVDSWMGRKKGDIVTSVQFPVNQLKKAISYNLLVETSEVKEVKKNTELKSSDMTVKEAMKVLEALSDADKLKFLEGEKRKSFHEIQSEL